MWRGRSQAAHSELEFSVQRLPSVKVTGFVSFLAVPIGSVPCPLSIAKD